MRIFTYVIALSLMVALTGCGSESRPQEAAEITPTIKIENLPESVHATETANVDEPETEEETSPTPTVEPEETTGAGRQDGERFEETIMLEGMEETVKYEHVINKELGFEMDFEYDSLIRQSDAEKERFVSVYDDPSSPDTYLEITREAESKDAAVESVKKELSETYEIEMDETTLEGAGPCVRFDAISLKGGALPDFLETVHVIPAGDGCIIARAHYTLEAAEGFGSRFVYMVNTLSVIDAK